MSEQKTQHSNAVQTTGHSWDGDLQEFNNPLPRWWVWTFYATILFSLAYWVLYPTWPYANTFTKGFGNTISYENSAGDTVTTHWNTRALLIKDMQSGKQSLKQQSYLQKVNAASYEEILNDAEMMAFAQSMAKVLYADNCAACHGPSGDLPAAAFGLYPNIADDDWLWGGSLAEIEDVIVNGRNGYMPAFAKTFNDDELEQVAHYVLSLSDHHVDTDKAKLGEAIFQGQKGGCYYCHGADAQGLKSQGAPNLTNAIWSVANVNADLRIDAKLAEVKKVIRHGVARQMPRWDHRLDQDQIRLLTIYVHELGGGE